MRLPALKSDAWLLLLGVSMLPVYTFGSGGVQPAHLVLALFAGLTLIRQGIPLISWVLALFSIFLYSFVVDGVYVILGGEPWFMIHSIFFFYNFVLATAIYLYVRANGLSVIVPGIFIAAAIALVTILATGVDLREMGEGGRATGTFNNPNQLGYFSVCLLSLGYLFFRHRSISYWVAAGIFAVSLFLAISSLSKAAMAANFMVILLALKPVSSMNAMLRWIGGSLLGVCFVLYLYLNGAFDDYLFMQRFMDMADESDSSLESRGYFAFLDGNVLQMLVGLGAQGVDDVVGHEVHSTLGSVVNNYGFVGLILFGAALVVWAIRLWQVYGLVGLICLAGPAMIYGITHNGIRFTIFWLLFAASMAMASRREIARDVDRSAVLVPDRRYANAGEGS